MKPLITLLLILSLGVNSFAQAPKAQKIVTNGDLTPAAQFHLLFIHQSADAITNRIAGMLSQPTGEMVNWSQTCNVRIMHVTESAAAENHADLLQKHPGQFPILALVEHTQSGKGAVWCSAAGRGIPTTESGLASWLGSNYAANIQAANEAGVQTNIRQNANPQLPTQPNFQAKQQSGGSYFMPRYQAPEPVRFPNLRRPFINPQVDVAMPDSLETSVGLQNGELLGIGAAAVAIICSMILAYGRTQAAQIHANAITDDPDDSPDDKGANK